MKLLIEKLAEFIGRNEGENYDKLPEIEKESLRFEARSLIGFLKVNDYRIIWGKTMIEYRCGCGWVEWAHEKNKYLLCPTCGGRVSQKFVD